MPFYIRRCSPTLIICRSPHREVNPTSPHVCGIALGPPPQSRLPEQGPPQRDKNPGLQERRHPNLLYGSENCPRDRRQVKVIPPTLLRSIPHIGCGDCHTDIGVWAEVASIESASIRNRLRWDHLDGMDASRRPKETSLKTDQKRTKKIEPPQAQSEKLNHRLEGLGRASQRPCLRESPGPCRNGKISGGED